MRRQSGTWEPKGGLLGCHLATLKGSLGNLLTACVDDGDVGDVWRAASTECLGLTGRGTALKHGAHALGHARSLRRRPLLIRLRTGLEAEPIGGGAERARPSATTGFSTSAPPVIRVPVLRPSHPVIDGARLTEYTLGMHRDMPS